MSKLTFRQWAYDEGFSLPLEAGSLEEEDAEKAYQEYLAEFNQEGEDKYMGKIVGTCMNCERPGMKINANRKGEGLCGLCQLSVKGLEWDNPERAVKLQEVKERMKDKGKIVGRPGKRKAFDPSRTAQASTTNPNRGAAIQIAIQPVDERDLNLMEGIKKLAERERRSPSAQILHMVEDIITKEITREGQ